MQIQLHVQGVVLYITPVPYSESGKKGGPNSERSFNLFSFLLYQLTHVASLSSSIVPIKPNLYILSL